MSALLESPKETKRRWPAADAIAVAKEIVDVLKPHCEKLIVAGSLRRRKPTVADIEFLFIPAFKVQPDPNDLFGNRRPINQTEIALNDLLKLGLIGKRPNINGINAWGPNNKLGIHVPSGMPVDFFTATRENFFNYLVCRTGGEESNVRVASAAIAMGWKWNPYGSGFSRPIGLSERREVRVMPSERDVFDFVGLPYLEPWKR